MPGLLACQSRMFRQRHQLPGAKKEAPEGASFRSQQWRSGSGGFVIFLAGHDRARILTLRLDVAVDEFDDGDGSGVGGADAGLDDAGVAAVAAGIARRERVEELLELCVVEEPGMGEAAVRKPALLRQRHQLLDIGPKLLRLGGGGGDLLMLDEGGRHVAEQGRTVAGGTLELTPAVAMTHESCLSFVRGPCEVSPARRWNRAPPKPQIKSAGTKGPAAARSSSGKGRRSQV